VKGDPWALLPTLESLEFLGLRGQESFTDATTATLLRMKSLKRLVLPTKGFTSASLASLAAHPMLEELDASPIDDDALVAIAGGARGAGGRVQILRTVRPLVTDTGLVALAGMNTNLRELRLTTCVKVTDAGARAIASLGQLTHLVLSSSKITDAGVAALAAMPNLVELDIGSCTKVTDASVPALKSMATLKMLRVTSTKITPQGIGELGASLRGCNLVTKG
jgi:hypothetical protein